MDESVESFEKTKKEFSLNFYVTEISTGISTGTLVQKVARCKEAVKSATTALSLFE